MGTSSIELAKRLKKIAKRQYGCFTAAQALEAGYAYSVHLYHVKKKEWIRVERGLYRLASAPESDATRLMTAQLWPRGKPGQVPCHFVGETAASIRAGKPSAKAPIELFVPATFRYTTKPPKGVRIVTAGTPGFSVRRMAGFSVEVPVDHAATVTKPPAESGRRQRAEPEFRPVYAATPPRGNDLPAFEQPTRSAPPPSAAAPTGMDAPDYYDLLDDQAVRGPR